MQFLHRLKLDQTTIDSAREAASNTASKTVRFLPSFIFQTHLNGVRKEVCVLCALSVQAEALRERSSSRVKLNVIIGAPLLVVPYTPPLSLSPPPSSSSPPPPALPPHQRAFVANLGELLEMCSDWPVTWPLRRQQGSRERREISLDSCLALDALQWWTL